jgi:hypothetical protein
VDAAIDEDELIRLGGLCGCRLAACRLGINVALTSERGANRHGDTSSDQLTARKSFVRLV